jgi:hypothetical protein
MPKFPTFQPRIDDLIFLSIKKLKEWEYIGTGKIVSGEVYWTSRGEKTNSIGVSSYNSLAEKKIHLSYQYQGEHRTETIYLKTIPSNLGKGLIWYFLCPVTGKPCRKLFCYNGRFVHREALKGLMYDCQAESKKMRWLEKYYGDYFREEKNYLELNSKHFKRCYNGKPTKRYLKLKKAIERAERIPLEEIERLYVL